MQLIVIARLPTHTLRERKHSTYGNLEKRRCKAHTCTYKRRIHQM